MNRELVQAARRRLRVRGFLVIWSLVSALAATSFSVSAAELVLRGGAILTMDDAQPVAEAVAISDGRFLAVGSEEAVLGAVSDSARIVDLSGAMAMPALHDAHLHPVKGGLKALYECSFPFSSTPQQVADTVARCVSEQPNALWIRGGQWDSGFFDRFDIASPREFLDRVSGDAAVILADDSNHNGWLNSKALQLLGIDASTPDPADGKILRDANGVPTGVLLEGAEQAAYDKLPDWAPDQYLNGAAEAVRIANAFGVVGLKDANASPANVTAYYQLDVQDRLSAYVATSLQTPYGARDEDLDLESLSASRFRYATDRIQTGYVKLFLDGVPTASRTAAMLAPYTPDAHGSDVGRGSLHLTADRLTRDVVALDELGFTVKIHTAGDRSVRVALDAIEVARRNNPASQARHELAHAGYIDPDDLQRFVELNAVADLSPYIWHPSGIIDSIILAVGKERGERYWPIRDLLDVGAPVLAGSDWPAAVETMDPWLGIEAMVTRKHPKEARDDALWSEQAVSLNEALQILTVKGARAIGVDDLSGSIEVGKSADFIILEQDLRSVPPEQISETKVLQTWLAGEQIYSQP